MSMMPMKLVLLGAPGAGKGTMTSRLLKSFPNLESISTGDLLRKQIMDKTEIGKEADGYIKSGRLIPDDTMISMLKGHLSSQNLLNAQSSWLLDGFPRTPKQASELHSALLPYDSDINLVVELDVPPEVIVGRVMDRWVHVPSGRVYNLSYNPPKVAGKDDVTGEPLSKRADDNVETLKIRLDNYYKGVQPIKDFYEAKGVLAKVSGETSDVIFPKLLDLINRRFQSKEKSHL